MALRSIILVLFLKCMANSIAEESLAGKALSSVLDADNDCQSGSGPEKQQGKCAGALVQVRAHHRFDALQNATNTTKNRTLCGLVALVDTSASFRLTTRTRDLALQDSDVEDLALQDKVRYHRDLNMHFNMDKTPTGQSLCIDGRLAPSIFLIGVQKGATTTLASQIEQSPSVVFGKSGKELHFFDFGVEWFNSKGGKKGGKYGYLHQFPSCPSNEKLVGLDGTPYTFHAAFAPKAIREIYGDAAGKLTFILTIREPMLRMQSAFYDARSIRMQTDGCKDDNVTDPPPWHIKPSVCKTTFNDYVKETLNSREGRLWQQSQYIPPLRQWFDAFAPSQFIIVPFLYVVDANRNPKEQVYQYMWRLLDVPSVRYVPDHLNEGSHPQLEDDIAPDVFEKLNQTFQINSSARGIARVLHRSGATLWGCSACDEGAIVDWIETGWR